MSLVVAGSFSSTAAADIYRCESDSGVPMYQNTPGKGCKKLDLTPVTSIPTPKATANRASTAARPANSGGDFPKVEVAAQGNRDSDKRRILDDELKKEEVRAAELRKEFKNGEVERRSDERNFEKYQNRVQKLKDDLARAEANVGSLRRELDLTK